MVEFKLKPEAYAYYIKSHNKALVLCIAAVLVVPFIFQFTVGSFELGIYIITSLINVFLVVFYLGPKSKIADMLKHNAILITNNAIVQREFNMADVAIDFTDITKIEKHRNNNLTIYTRHWLQTITVSNQLNGFDTVEEILQKIKPVTINTKWLQLKNIHVLLLFFPYLVWGIFSFSGQYTVWPICAILISIYLCYYFLIIQKSPAANQNSKDMSWSALVIALLLLGFTLYKIL